MLRSDQEDREWLWMVVDVDGMENGDELSDQFGLVGWLISQVGFVFFYNG